MPSPTTARRRQYVKQLKRTGLLVCGLCGFGIANAKEITVDHIVPKSKGGGDNPENLQPAHRTCNELKSNQKLTTWINPFTKEPYEKTKPKRDDKTSWSSVAVVHANPAMFDQAEQRKHIVDRKQGSSRTKRDYHYKRRAAHRKRNLLAERQQRQRHTARLIDDERNWGRTRRRLESLEYLE